MKKIYKLVISTFIIVLVLSTGCKKVIDEDVNIDPNKPADVPMSLLLQAEPVIIPLM